MLAVMQNTNMGGWGDGETKKSTDALFHPIPLLPQLPKSFLALSAVKDFFESDR